MKISGIEGAVSAPSRLHGGTKTEQSPGAGQGFADLLSDYVEHVDSLQQAADAGAKSLALGKVQHPHDLAMMLNEAEMSFRLMTQVRNKMVRAYREVMQMKV